MPGRVTSIASSRRRRSSSPDESASARAACSASSRLRTPFSAAPALPALAGLERRDAAQCERDRCRASEHGDARELELVAGGRLREGAASLLLEPFDVVHAHSAPVQGRGRIPAPAVPPCLPLPVPGDGPSLRAETGGVPTGSEGELRWTAPAGALTLGPAPCLGAATRLLVLVSAGPRRLAACAADASRCPATSPPGVMPNELAAATSAAPAVINQAAWNAWCVAS